MTDGIPTLRHTIAALIANTLIEQSQDSGGYVNTGEQFVEDSEVLDDVLIDGHFDLEAIAEAVITEVRADMIANE
jgi:hypothetical protein